MSRFATGLSNKKAECNYYTTSLGKCMLRLSNLTEVMSDCNFTLVDANLALFIVFYLYG